MFLCVAVHAQWNTSPSSSGSTSSAICEDANTTAESATCEQFIGKTVYVAVIDLANPTYYNPATLDLTHNLGVEHYLETTLILKTAAFGTSYAPARNVWSNSVIPTSIAINDLGNMFSPSSIYANYFLKIKYTKQ